MNLKQHLLTTAAAATALFGIASAPAQAFSFGQTVKFDTDTTVDFSFLESHGYFKTQFGIVGSDGVKTSLLTEKYRSDNGSDSNDWQGTCGTAVVDCLTSFTFKANTTYNFFLQGINPTGGIYGIDAKSKFFNAADTATVLADTKYKDYNTSPDSLLAKTASSETVNPFAESVLIAFDDSGKDKNDNIHLDYNDFMVMAKVRESASVPEPTTLLGLGLVAGTLSLTRRRKSKVSQFS